MPRLANHFKKILLAMLVGTFAVTGFALETNSVFHARAEKAFLRTQQSFQTNSLNSSNAWLFACACFDLAQFATNDTRKASLARLGIAACQQLVAREPKSAAGHYYLAMNYGELADAEAPSLLAYRLVHDVESEFKLALDLDEKFDYGGPSRCLGLLYRDAPGWPLSVGGWRKAHDFLERAAKTAPEYPENQLNLAETYLRWHQRDDAERTLKKTDAVWSGAQTNLAGEFWEQSWADWTKRRAAAKAEFQKQFKHAPGT